MRAGCERSADLEIIGPPSRHLFGLQRQIAVAAALRQHHRLLKHIRRGGAVADAADLAAAQAGVLVDNGDGSALPVRAGPGDHLVQPCEAAFGAKHLVAGRGDEGPAGRPIRRGRKIDPQPFLRDVPEGARDDAFQQRAPPAIGQRIEGENAVPHVDGIDAPGPAPRQRDQRVAGEAAGWGRRFQFFLQGSRDYNLRI